MMNRSVMGRQMFAAGGAAFPDISGDGQVTQKDILMGRGVLPRPMQEGGIADPMMMQGMDPSMVPQEDPMMAQQGEVDPEVLAGMFGQMETQMSGIEDSEDLEGMMNAVRGDQQPVEARRAELASFVGPEDAQVTPESVLALVQPVMQLASLDQGIGGLAEAEMSGVSMEGPMGEGIMSTVNTAPDAAPMPPPTGQAMMDPAMMGVGNQPPVNFRQGGVVQYMQAGGAPGAGYMPTTIDPLDLQKSTEARLRAMENVIGPRPDQSGNLQEQKELAKSQMYFDLANTALAFATPGSRQMSPAERLAEAARETQLFDKIGARSQNVLDLKKEEELAAYNDRSARGIAAFEAASKAEQLEAQRQLELERQGRGFGQEQIVLDQQQRFTERQAGLDRSSRKDLQGTINDTQIRIRELGNSGSQADIALRGQLQADLADQSYLYSKSLLADESMYADGRLTRAQDHESNLLERGAEINTALTILRADRSDQADQLRSELNQDSMRLGSELSENQARLNFERRREELDIIQDYDMTRLEEEYDLRGDSLDQVLKNNKKLYEFQNDFVEESRLQQNLFQSEQRALDRMAQEKSTFDRQTFENYTREEVQKFTSDQSLLDRLMNVTRQNIDFGLKTRQLDLQENVMSMDQAQNFFSNQLNGYKAYTDRIGKSLQLVGSKSKDASLRFLTDPKNIKSLSEGKSSNLYNQALIDYLTPSYNAQTSETKQVTLAPALRSALENYNKVTGTNLLSDMKEQSLVPGTAYSLPGYALGGMVRGAGVLATAEASPETQVNVQNLFREKDSLERMQTPALTAEEVRSPEFNMSLLKSNGSIDLESPSWRAVPTTIFDPSVKYEVATGLGGAGTRLGNYFTETGREASLGLIGPMGPEGRNLVQADRDLIGLKNKLLMELTSFADDRILKFVQEELAKDVEGLKPGMWTSDEKALATLTTLSKTLGTAFNSVIKGLPEYAGEAQLYRPAEVTKYRAKAETLKGLIAETISFKDSYESYITKLGGRLDDNTRKEAREFLANLGKK